MASAVLLFFNSASTQTGPTAIVTRLVVSVILLYSLRFSELDTALAVDILIQEPETRTDGGM